MKSVAEEVAGILLDVNAISFNVARPYTFASGIKSPIYTDLRLLMSYPQQRERVVELLSELVEKRMGLDNIDIISGTASAGIPWAAWLSEKLKKPMIYVRKESKHYGKERLIEGVIEEGKRVLVVEDLISTGGSSIRSVHNIRGCMGIMKDCVAIFNYGLDESRKNFSEMNVKVSELCDFKTAVDVAVRMNCLTKEQAKKAAEWNRNPRKWNP
jgi:orotate phosphoribosyltransferase